MMRELARDRFGEVATLWREAGGTFPIVAAVLEGSQNGQVFVSDAAPDAAFMVSDVGFVALVERAPSGAMDAALATLLGDGTAIRPSYLLWYDPPARWQARLDGEGVRRRERLRFGFNPASALYLGETAAVPAGFQLARMTPGLLAEAERFGLALDSKFWRSAEDFLRDALAVCLVRDGEVASLCYAAAIGGGHAEIDVVTAEGFRGAGLGTILAQEFARLCVAQRLVPAWDCFTANSGSMKLAVKLGFVPVRTYPFYSFNIPVALAPPSG